ncbi:hypothetical protein J31TS4_44240 [Paenibacillus sp. J31TS4]|nr:hypothetical protein [Paenibacillus sp. J31TS4]GIP41144.1 hypothetical protein J31TS4_44240 [Paenibacillus sp. J31TS4]
MTMLLLLVVMAVYTGTVGGPEGTGHLVKEGGRSVNRTIERINP